MTENGPNRLRAPDPTLTELGVHPNRPVAVNWDAGPVPVAHLTALYPEGDPQELVTWWPRCDPEMENDNWRECMPESAAWFAVPCRECFPSAPPPGHRACDCPHEDHPFWEDPDLGWQTTR